jgi:hypothetical protein
MPTYGNKNFRNIGTGGTNIYQRLSSGGGSGGSGSGNIVATMRAKGPATTGLGASTAYTQICSDPKNFPFMGRSNISSYYSYSFATFKNNTSSYAILQMTMSSAWVPPAYYKVSINSINASYGGNEPQRLGSAYDSSNADRLYFCLVEPQAGFGLMLSSDSNAKGNQYSGKYSEASILSNIGGYTGDQLFASHSDLTNIWTDIGAPTNSQIYIADVYG